MSLKLIEASFLLPVDVLLIPGKEFSTQARKKLKCAKGDYVITRPGARLHSQVVNSTAAALLKEFRTSKTIAEAIIHFSEARNIDPAPTLEIAFPLLKHLINSRVMVPANSDAARQILPTLRAGERFAGWRIIDAVQILEDTEVYQVEGSHRQRFAALKVVHGKTQNPAGTLLKREAEILRRLDGQVNPRLIRAGSAGNRPYLLAEWCNGLNVSMAADAFRRRQGGGRAEIFNLCCKILQAYSHLHAQQLIHSDVHPGNLLLTADGDLKILDYGLARFNRSNSLRKPARGGIAYYFEPEYAQAKLARSTVPSSTELGEQYSLAAVLYKLITDHHYLDFSFERETMFRQISNEKPLPFASHGVRPWPELEAVLAKALNKEPSTRFSSMSDFAEHFRQLSATPKIVGNRDGTKSANNSRLNSLLTEVLERIGIHSQLFQSGLRAAPTCSIHSGASGIAYALYRVACLREDSRLLALADLWSSRAIHNSTHRDAFFNTQLHLTPKTVGPVSLYNSLTGIHCAQALISRAMGDLTSAFEAVQTFTTAAAKPCENLDLFLGKSGVLLGCSLLMETIGNETLFNRELLMDLGKSVSLEVRDEIESFAPIGECPELPSLGIAHGWAGVLYAQMRWSLATGSPLPESMRIRLHELEQCAETIGRCVRWPVKLQKLGRPKDDVCVSGWCNGSAGHIHLWILAYRMFGEEVHVKLAEGAASDIVNAEEDGVVPFLCCGRAGHAYALLNLYKSTGDSRWVAHARKIAEAAAFEIRSAEFPVNSLYRGEIGVALLAADISHPEMSSMPLFENEGWARGAPR